MSSPVQDALDVGFAALLTSAGDAATYTPSGGSAAAITVVFDEAHQIVDPETLQLISTAPMAKANTSDVPNAAKGDTLVINSVTYYVIEPKPDGLGMTELLLSRVAGP